ncbi:MAG: hypothetical protein J6A91_06060 [Bacteroidales bacterium]|nr:hypothetical protein [Bacteroidales bacterium]MBP3661989.1 hypothetical protein [Bacteroidales bacterium]
MKENKLDYQAPRISELEVCTEGALCNSQLDGLAPGLGMEDLGDIWC